jgi:hypothetical protein
MRQLDIRDLRDDLTFGATVTGLGWDNIEDEAAA